MTLENFKFTFEEVEDGYTVHLKGDKEKLKRKLEAFEAFLNFKEKAKAADIHHHHSFGQIHQMFKEMHKGCKHKHHSHKEDK